MKFKIDLKFKIKNLKFPQRGVAALITILALGGIIFIVSMSTALLAFWSSQNAYASRWSDQAYYAAYSGVQDALIQLERNKDFSSDGYNLSVYSSNDVSVVVTNNTSSATITATASEKQMKSKLQTIVDIDSATGLITPTSTTELTL